MLVRTRSKAASELETDQSGENDTVDSVGSGNVGESGDPVTDAMGNSVENNDPVSDSMGNAGEAGDPVERGEHIVDENANRQTLHWY